LPEGAFLEYQGAPQSGVGISLYPQQRTGLRRRSRAASTRAYTSCLLAPAQTPSLPTNKTREQGRQASLSGPSKDHSTVSTQTLYEPRFDLDLQRGQVQETLVRRLVSNEPDHFTLEVKGDYRAQDTGNHFIEVQQRARNGNWRDSGIRTTESDYWAVALPDGVVVMVPTAKVRRWPRLRWTQGTPER
jgi:hypothetical protein